MSNENSLNLKLKNIYIIIFIFCLALVGMCFRWQIVEASKFEEIQSGRVYSSEIDSLRGGIYAKDGTTLAYSEPIFDMYIWMDDLVFFEEKGLQTREEFIGKIAPIIDTTPEQLKEVIKKNYEENDVRWFLIAKSLTSNQWEKIINLKTDSNPNRLLQGFSFVNSSKRNYPEGQLAAHVVGLTNKHRDKIIGSGGLEGYWDGVLNPIKGFTIQEDNAIGEVVATSLLPTVEPKSGSSIYTSIDKKLQQIVEDKIKEGVEKYEAESGTVIVMDPKTGQILALANYPTYNPNTREAEAEAFGNIAVTEPYETGSTGKVLTIASAIDLGVIDPDTIILPDGHQGCEKIHRDLLPLCTWDKKPQPAMTASDCFVKSDNVCFFHIATKLKNIDFYNYLYNFGVGRSSGIDLAGESYGILKQAGQWNTGDVAAFSYGHGYQLNSIQSIDAISVIANDGVRMQPYVVTKIIDNNGKVDEYKPKDLGRVIKSDTASKVTNMMRTVYSQSILNNEYYYHHLRSYDIAMKSGTALVADQNGYGIDINSSYVGFDASANKTFIMLVKLEKPQIPAYDRLSFYNSRMVWLDTFDAIKDHLNVPRK